jgi:CRP/FNR family transcriptional regulator
MTPRRTKALSADADVLRRVSHFRTLSASALRALARECSPRTLASGQTLFEEGAPGTHLFVIAAGRVEVRQTSLRGREQVFHTEAPGAALGEAPLLDGGGYIASAVALEPTRVLALPRARLLALCRRHPEVALAIARTLARRVRRFADLVGDLAFRPVPERLARYLVSASGERPLAPGLELDLRLTQAQLAARLGTVRELVARALAQLDQAGLIARRGTRIVVRDPARLLALAEGRVT